MPKERFSPITYRLADIVRAAKQKEERLELEGNSVFQDLRMEWDVLREQRVEEIRARFANRSNHVIQEVFTAYDALRAELATRAVALVRLREALLKHHHPFQHDYVKDEKACPTCRLIAEPTGPAPRRRRSEE